jgi:hypothetical protein
VISWIRNRIRIRINLQMTSQNVWNMSLYEHFFKGLSFYLEEVGYGPASGSASGWKVGSASASNENPYPDPHQIKIRIRIRIRVISRICIQIHINLMGIHNTGLLNKDQETHFQHYELRS